MQGQCHMRVVYESLVLDYQAGRSAAHRFAEAVRPMGAVVTIDDDLRGTLRRLPAEALFA